MTVRELLTKTMSLIGAISSGEAISASEAADGLASLNNMLDSWSADGLMPFDKVVTAFAFGSGLTEYSFTAGSNNFEFATATVSGVEVPLKILSFLEWAAIPDKTLTGPATAVFIEDTGGTLKLKPFPVPLVATSISLYYGAYIGGYGSVNDELSLAVGYFEAVQYNLAIRLGIEFGKSLNPLIVEMANDLKAQLMRNNIKPQSMVSDAAGMSSDHRPFHRITTGE